MKKLNELDFPKEIMYVELGYFKELPSRFAPWPFIIEQFATFKHKFRVLVQRHKSKLLTGHHVVGMQLEQMSRSSPSAIFSIEFLLLHRTTCKRLIVKRIEETHNI